MSLDGTVVNGVIVLDGGAQLPEGTRVRVEAEDAEDLSPPEEPYDREKELAILREALEDVKAGRGVDAREFLKKIAEEFDLSRRSPAPSASLGETESLARARG